LQTLFKIYFGKLSTFTGRTANNRIASMLADPTAIIVLFAYHHFPISLPG
jgi:hypothetical protein